MPPEDDKKIADVWKTVGEAASKCGVSIGEMAEAVRILSRNSVSAVRAGENLSRGLQRIIERREEEKHRKMVGVFWRCQECSHWNHQDVDFCAFCGMSLGQRRHCSPKRGRVRVIRFLKKLREKDVC